MKNPQDVVAWLRRIGRDAVLIEHDERPVPLEEVDLRSLPDSHFVQIEKFLAAHDRQSAARGSRADPRLRAAPQRERRNGAGDRKRSAGARSAAAFAAQEALAGKRLAKLLRNRVAYHHSGLSYAVRAGLIEPLAKAGQLNVVVATMGLAAGINFSMRSVLITDTRYMAGNFERQVQPDELLQMFGRAGRRGLDETGYVLFARIVPRLSDAQAASAEARHTSRLAKPDQRHARRGRSAASKPFAAAVRAEPLAFQRRRRCRSARSIRSPPGRGLRLLGGCGTGAIR